MKALILGCGYLGRRVAERWLDAGHAVSALTRSTDKAAELLHAGIAPVVGDVTLPQTLATLPAVDVVLYSIGYDRSAGVDRRTVVLDGLRNALDALRGKTECLVFISTTSVYGQSNGEWIDENSPTAPQTEAGRLALAAEQFIATTSHIPHPKSQTLRLSGLYGPSRLLRRAEQLRSGVPIAGSGDAWLNLIHVEDAATAVMATAQRLLDGRDRPNHNRQGAIDAAGLLLVSDDRPVRRREYYGRLAELTGSPPPAFDPSQATRSTGLGKRCRNERMKHELGLRPAYATFEEGLADAVRPM